MANLTPKGTGGGELFVATRDFAVNQAAIFLILLASSLGANHRSTSIGKKRATKSAVTRHTAAVCLYSMDARALIWRDSRRPRKGRCPKLVWGRDALRDQFMQHRRHFIEKLEKESPSVITQY